MKKNILMNFCLVIMLFVSGSVLAQEGRRSGPPPGPPKAMDPIQVTDRLNDLLDLSSEQYAEVLNIQNLHKEQMTKMKEERATDNMEMAIKRRELAESRDIAMKEVLTSDQYKEYLEKQKMMRQKRRSQRK